MQEYKIILTWEAIYDVTDIADYIEEEFGQQRADRFQSDLKEQMQNLSQFSTAFPRTQILYRGYSIHKRSFPPSIIFYIIMEETKEIHIYGNNDPDLWNFYNGRRKFYFSDFLDMSYDLIDSGK